MVICVFATNPDDRYGGQLNHRAIDGVPAEANVSITYTEIPGTYADGSAYSLRRPTYVFTHAQYGEIDEGLLVSPRVAPHLVGLGLLEAIPESDILARADPADENNDGISGRANYVMDVSTGELALGRIGWKASQPHIRQQVAAAFKR